MAPNVRLTAEQYRGALDGLLEGVQIFDRDLRYVYVNPAAAAQGRQTVRDVVGRLLTEVFPGSETSEFFAALRAVLETGIPRRLQTEFALGDGSVGTYDLIIEAVDDGVVVLSIETTSRAAAERALQEALARYRGLLESLPDYVFLLDRRGLVLDVHLPRTAASPWHAEELVGRSVFAWLAPAFAARAQDALRTAVETGQTQALQYEVPMADGVRYFEANVAPGADDRITVVARDVTARIHLERQLQQAQKMEAVGQLTGGIAHDFNNVLQIISANAELLATALEERGEAVPSELADIRSASRNGADMVAQLLQFSRRAPIQRQLVEPGAALHRITSMLRRILPSSVTLDVDALPSGLTISLDTGALDQIIANLCTNSRDAMPSGGRIHIRHAVVPLTPDLAASFPWLTPGDYLCLQVVDNGVGMTEETLQRIFEPFFTTKDVGLGTGLGMAMVYGVMRAHRGAVAVRSTLGEGTEVRLLFPLVDAPVAADLTSLSSGAKRVDGGGETILLVEDDAAIRAVMRRVLDLKGYRVLEAADGAAGLAIFRQHPSQVQLVISDLVMPKLGGRHMADAIRAEAPTVPLLFSSGYAGGEVADLAELPPNVHVLAKPWKLSEFLTAVRRAIDGTLA